MQRSHPLVALVLVIGGVVGSCGDGDPEVAADSVDPSQADDAGSSEPTLDATRTIRFDLDVETNGCMILQGLDSDNVYFFNWSPATGPRDVADTQDCNDQAIDPAAHTIRIPDVIPDGLYEACLESPSICRTVQVGNG